MPTISIDKLRRDSANRNKGTGKGRRAVKESLETFGAGRSILLDRHGVVIAGNQTLNAALEAGFDNVVVVETTGKELVAVKRTDLDLTEKTGRARALSLSDNRCSELGWNPDLQLLAEDLRSGLELPESILTPDEVSAMLAKQVESAALAADLERGETFGGGIPVADGANDAPSGLLEDAEADEIPEDVPTRVKLGEIWELGRHRVACLSSTDSVTLARLLGDEAPGMVFADPPYGIDIVRSSNAIRTGEASTPLSEWKRGTVGGSKPFGSKAVRGTVGSSNVVAANRYAPILGDETTETAVGAYELCTAQWPKAIHIWWGGNYYANALPPSSCWLVWDKQATGGFADAELAWTNQKTAVRLFQHRWCGMVKASEHGEKRCHPTQKPVALAEWVYERYGEGVDLIFDPFLGSGMSLIAAEKTGRRVFGCELSPAYCDIVISRWEKATGQEARRLS
jgi:DNA methylase